MNKFENILNDKRPHGIFTAIVLLILAIGFTFAIWTIAQGLIIVYFMGGAASLMDGIKNLSPEFEIKFAFGVFFGSSIIGICAVFIWKHFIERLPLMTIFNATNHFRWRLFWLGAIIGPMMVIIGIIASIFTDDSALNMLQTRINSHGIINYLLLIPMWSVAIFFQAGFEEILVRSQFMQYLKRSKLPIWAAAIVASFSFGMLHWLPDTSITTNINIVIATCLMGLSFAYATWRTNGIELAMGAHILNNIVVMSIIGQADNRTIGNEALISSIIYLLVFVGLLELSLKLLPDFLKEKGRGLSS